MKEHEYQSCMKITPKLYNEQYVEQYSINETNVYFEHNRISPFTSNYNELHLYLVERTDYIHYGQYISLVVAAYSEQDARIISPDSSYVPISDLWVDNLNDLKVTNIGVAHPNILRGVILSSFDGG